MMIRKFVLSIVTFLMFTVTTQAQQENKENPVNAVKSAPEYVQGNLPGINAPAKTQSLLLNYGKNKKKEKDHLHGARRIQESNQYFIYGIKAGYIHSVINALETTILSEPFFLNDSMEKRWKKGYIAGAYFNYRPVNSKFSAEVELTYSLQGSDLYFNDSSKDFHYLMQFKNQYINLTPMVRFHPFGDVYDEGGLSLFGGVQIGLNVAPDAIFYKSGGTGYLPAFGTDLEQQQQLRNVLKGKNNFGLVFGIGYEIPNIRVSIDAKAHWGLTDVIETKANSYNFIENHNNNNALIVTLGWHFERGYDR